MGLSSQTMYDRLSSSLSNVTTRNTYITRLKNLERFLAAPLYEIVKDPWTYGPRIKAMYARSMCSQRNMVATVLAIFKHFPDLASKKHRAFQQWQDMFNFYKTYLPPMRPNITRQEIEKQYNQMTEPHKTLRESLDRLLLSMALYMSQQSRGDYGAIAIVFAPNKRSPSENYIYMKGSKNSFMVYHNKKTILHPTLFEDIRESMSRYPRSFLFVDANNMPYEKTNSYNVFVIRSFQRMFNRRVGMNALRKI